MHFTDLLWLIPIAGVWHLLGTKRRREQRAWRNSTAYVSHSAPASSAIEWIGVILVLAYIAFHH